MAESHKTSIPIKILNVDLKIKTDESEDYLRDVVRYVESKINEVIDTMSTSSPIKMAILAALNITDELFREKQKTNERLQRLCDLISQETDDLDL